MQYPTTPDGRYFVVRGRLWRCSDPSLSEKKSHAHVHDLMALAAHSPTHPASRISSDADAHAKVDAAKVALGERGGVWWKDGAPDHNRKMVGNTPYKSWFESLT